jgi:ABC-type oligopeptide transport system ATPase subunit
MQMIFQDPYASLNPRLPAFDLVTEPLVIHEPAAGRDERRARAEALLARVGLEAEHLDRFPHQFSGGQRQRLAIARALCLSPRLIVADEPVSALDVSVQAQVLSLMRELQEELGLSYLFISHDMGTVERMSHRVAVMYLGQIVEIGPTAEVLGKPRHPYTRRLLASVPVPDPTRRPGRPGADATEIASPIRLSGDEPPTPPLVAVGPAHFVQETIG